MKVQRLTITIPEHVVSRLRLLAPKRGVSEFVSEAIEEKMSQIQYKIHETPLDRLFRVAEKLPKYSTDEIQKAIDKGKK